MEGWWEEREMREEGYRRSKGKRESEKQWEREGRVLIWAGPGGSLQGRKGNDWLANQALIWPQQLCLSSIVNNYSSKWKSVNCTLICFKVSVKHHTVSLDFKLINYAFWSTDGWSCIRMFQLSKAWSSTETGATCKHLCPASIMLLTEDSNEKWCPSNSPNFKSNSGGKSE